ncbi:hypothetical protein HN51_013502 [Arachis hypogaea]
MEVGASFASWVSLAAPKKNWVRRRQIGSSDHSSHLVTAYPNFSHRDLPTLTSPRSPIAIVRRSGVVVESRPVKVVTVFGSAKSIVLVSARRKCHFLLIEWVRIRKLWFESGFYCG